MSYYGLRSLKFIVSTPNLYLSKEEARDLGAYDETIEVIKVFEITFTFLTCELDVQVLHYQMLV